MERTVALISHAFAGSDGLFRRFGDSCTAIEEEHQRIFVADAFSNPDHLKFAIRGMLATLLAYVVYTALDWPGRSVPPIATCIIPGGAIHDRIVTAEAVPPAWRSNYRRLRLWHGSASFCASSYRFDYGLRDPVRGGHSHIGLDWDVTLAPNFRTSGYDSLWPF